MANINILNLPVAISLDGNEYAPVVQGDVTKRARTSLFDISGSGGGPQAANTVYAGPTSGAASNPSFRTLVAADMPLGTAGYALIGNGSSVPTYQAFTQVGTGAVARTWQGKDEDTINVLDFIPVALHAAIKARTSSTDVSSYIQAAVDAAAYQTLVWPGGKYTLSSVVTISSPVYLLGSGRDAQYSGGGSTYVALSDDTATGFQINSPNVILEKLDISGTANRAAGSARAISIGTYTAIDVDVTTNNTVTRLTGSWASSDNGKRIRIAGAGTEGAANYYYGILSGYSAGTPTVMAVSPTTTSNPSGAAAIYGSRITGVILRDLAISSHAVGIEIVSADQYLIDDCFLSNTDSIKISNVLGVDSGDSIITNSFIAADGSTGSGIYYVSGGALRIANNKFSTCDKSIEIVWTEGLSGGPLVVANSFENQTTSAIHVSGDSSDARINGLTIVGNWFNGGSSANILIADTINVTRLHVASNTVLCGSSNRGIIVGALVDGFNIAANLIDGNSVAACVGIEIKSGAANGFVGSNTFDNLTTQWSNAGTNVTFGALDPTTTAGDTIYRNASALTRLAIGSSNTVMTSSGSAPQWSAALTLADGSAGAPAYSFASDPDTGMYLSTANTLRFATNGVEAFRLSSAGNGVFAQSLTVQGTNLTVSSVQPTSTWTDTDGSATADGRTVRVRQFFSAGSEYFRWDAVNDAGSVVTTMMDFKRTTTTVDYFRFYAGASTGTLILEGTTSALTISAPAVVSSANASALTVGANGATNPVLKINSATASVATGLQVTGAAAAGGVAVAAISSGTNENLTIDAKGSGTITLGGTSTGNIVATRAIAGALGITSSSPTAGIGYATGAGGTVTQATNKSTGVTLNTVTGTITMNNASLAASTTVGFTLTNSTIGADDIILVNIKSGASADSYAQPTVSAKAVGSCRIEIRNTSGGSLGEAVVLSFVVIKGVAA